MRIGAMLANVVLVAGAILFGGCMASVDENTGNESAAAEATEDENVGEAEQALTSCSHNCHCPLGYYCSNGFCSYVQFGPSPPEPYCYDSCQCAWPEKCKEYHPGWAAGYCD